MRHALLPLNCLLVAGLLVGCGGGVNGVYQPGVEASKYSWQVGGNLTGLPGGYGYQVELTNNGAETLTLKQDGAFNFPTPVTGGSRYAVAVSSKPEGIRCDVANGSADSILDNVGNVSVTCGYEMYTLAGRVDNLSNGASLSLRLSLTMRDGTLDARSLTVVGDGNTQWFSFPKIPYKSQVLALEVSLQPDGLQCNPSGLTPNLEITTNIVAKAVGAGGVAVNCSPPPI